MKKLFSIRSLFLINGFVEMIGGVLVLLYPSLLLLGGELTTESVAIGKMYGLAAFLIGVISYQCFKHYGNNSSFDKILFLSFSIFHLLIGFQMFGNFQIGIVSHPGPFIFHISIAVILIGAFLLNKEELG